MKKIFKVLLSLVVVVLMILAMVLLLLTITDYRPESVEDLDLHVKTSQGAKGDEVFSIHSWNIGYGALGDQEDFFLDGGDKVIASSKKVVTGYFDNILDTLDGFDSDFLMVQEIDVKSKRAYKINELDEISKRLEAYTYSFAKNYDVLYIPMPWPPMGQVKAGLGTFSLFDVDEATRYKFDSNYAWPTKTVMLDRCFMVSRIKLKDKANDLLLINAHFSAYDDGSLKEKQLKTMKDFMTQAYESGDYVVLGGDWNQTFESVDTREYPLFENGDWFLPSVIAHDWLDEGWTYGVADNAPTYRLLNAAYEKGVSQVGVVDGFVVSPNVSIEHVSVLDLDFKDSDHNPVHMTFKLD